MRMRIMIMMISARRPPPIYIQFLLWLGRGVG
jgi:hypothetical protein